MGMKCMWVWSVCGCSVYVLGNSVYVLGNSVIQCICRAYISHHLPSPLVPTHTHLPSPLVPTHTQDIIEQQSQVARVMRLLHTPTATQRVAVFKLIEGRLLQGLPTRYKYTLPSLIIAVLELVQGIADGSVPLGDDAGEVCVGEGVWGGDEGGGGC